MKEIWELEGRYTGTCLRDRNRILDSSLSHARSMQMVHIPGNIEASEPVAELLKLDNALTDWGSPGLYRISGILSLSLSRPMFRLDFERGLLVLINLSSSNEKGALVPQHENDKKNNRKPLFRRKRRQPCEPHGGPSRFPTAHRSHQYLVFDEDLGERRGTYLSGVTLVTTELGVDTLHRGVLVGGGLLDTVTVSLLYNRSIHTQQTRG